MVDHNSGPLNVRSFGAVGDGIHDDTAAIEAAHHSDRGVGGLFFPAGKYRYRGGGLDGETYQIAGAGSGRTIIALEPGAYFLMPSKVVTNARVEGIQSQGGAGFFKHTYTGVNVAFPTTFRDCRFHGYSACAIGTLAADFPYLFVEDCVFDGTSTSSIGLAHPGDMSMGHVLGCVFMRNRYHIKLKAAGLCFRIRDNDFLRFDRFSGTPRIDIWLVPHETPVNAGTGLLIDGNKFGNENLNVADYRILYADEDATSGTDVTTRTHAQTASRGVIDGHLITNNRVTAIGERQPFIFSTTDRVQHLTICDNDFVGAPSSVVEFLNPNGGDRMSMTSRIGPNTTPTPGEIGYLASNRPGFATLLDPAGAMLETPGALQSLPGAGWDTEYRRLLTQPLEEWTAEKAVVTPRQPGPLHERSAVLIEAVSAGAYVHAVSEPATATVPTFVEIDLRARDRDTRVELQVRGGNGTLWVQRMLRAGTGWRRYRLVHVPRESLGQSFRIALPDGGAVYAARPALYHAREPIALGPKTIEVLSSAVLPQPDATQDGRVLIEDTGSGEVNLVAYAGGRRFRIGAATPF